MTTNTNIESITPELRLQNTPPHMRIRLLALEDDLCTLSDVKGRLNPETNIEDNHIIQSIRDVSERIRYETENPGLNKDNIIAKWACIYGVLLDLTQRGLISLQEGLVSSFSDGDFSISYKHDEKVGDQPVTVEGYYQYYLNMLLDIADGFIVVDPP